MKKLYLIDGMSLLFRAYHAMSNNKLINSAGEPTGAIFGFINQITSILDKEKPEHIAVAFDLADPTFRHIKYELYKANRDACPDDLVPQIPKVKEFLDLAGIPRLEKPGFEADDIIGTLSHKASLDQWEVYCITSDKDYYQLINDRVFLLKPGFKGSDYELVHYDGVKSKFGVNPDQVIDVLAIIGDSSDNVPGVKGVGDKTAIPLVQEFGTLENIYNNLDKIPKKSLVDKLQNSKEMAFLSKELVTIDCDVELELNHDALHLREIKFKELNEFFKNAGFRQLREKWMNKAINSGVEIISQEQDEPIKEESIQTINDLKKEYHLVTKDNILDIIDKLKDADIIAVDTETDSLDRDSCELVGISLSIKENQAFYIPVAPLNSKVQSMDSLFDFEEKKIDTDSKNIDLDFIIKHLKPILEDKKIGKLGQNIKFDAYILKRFGIEISPIIFDTMIADYVINPDNRHNLDALSERWLNYKPIPISELIGEKKSTQITMREVDIDKACEYACEDADLAFKLYNKLNSEIQNSNLKYLAEEIEFPLVEVLTDMESIGVSIDSKALSEFSIQITKEAAELTEKIYKEAGTEFNIDSPKQMAHILFEKLMLPTNKKTKTGFSTDVSVLSELSADYPIAEYILNYRQLMKLKSTYVDALPKLINPKTNRIHTTYNQTVASTGRLSSTDPNLQNIPIRTDLGKEIRKAFVAENDNYKILSADYSQVELRIMAYMCRDEYLIKAFQNGLDIHTATAANLYGIPIEEVNSDMRRVAKTVNFGIMYGLGSFGLSQRLGISRTEASEIIKNYFAKYPGIKQYMDDTIKSTSEKGYAETLCGRRRYFIDINSKNHTLRSAAERAAINMPIQGTASDMMKLAMIRVHKALKTRGLKSKMLLQVHDELIFEIHNSELEILPELVVREMSEALKLGDVPVIVESGIGANWLEAH